MRYRLLLATITLGAVASIASAETITAFAVQDTFQGDRNPIAMRGSESHIEIAQGGVGQWTEAGGEYVITAIFRIKLVSY